MTSFLDELAAIRERVRATAEKTMSVPGSAGRMAVRFKPPKTSDARDRLTGVVAAYMAGGAMSHEQELQLLVDCCDEILRRDDDGELVRVADENAPDTPLVFDASDPRWGTDVKTAHDCVAKLFNLDDIPLAVSGIADALIDWMQGIDAEANARAEGKSAAATAEKP